MIAYYFLLTDHFIYIFKSADCSMNLMKIPKTLSSGNVFRKLKSQQAKKKKKIKKEIKEQRVLKMATFVCFALEAKLHGFKLALDLSALAYLKSLCR